MYDTEAWRAITDELDEFVSEMVAEPERNDPSTQLLLFIEEEIAKLEQRVLAALGFSPGASKRYQADLAGMGASLFDLFFENLDDYRPSGKVADEQPITLFDLTYGGCVTDFMKEWKLDDARLQRSLSMVPEWKRWSQAMLQGESPASVDEQAAQTSTEQLERSVS